MEEGEPVRILVVDDEAVILHVVSEVLTKYGGFEVDSIDSSVEALKLLKRRNYLCDLLLTDLQMPGLTGQELMAQAMEVRPELGVVIITAYDNDENALACLKKGALDYIAKPIEVEKFLDTMRRAAKAVRNIDTQDLLEIETPLVGWMETTTPNDVEYLERFNSFLTRLHSLPFSLQERKNLRLVIDEIGKKIKALSADLGKNSTLKMSYTVFSEQLTVVIEDSEIDFASDWKEAMRQGDKARPELRTQIKLFFDVMDEVLFSEGGNIVLMSKKFNVPVKP